MQQIKDRPRRPILDDQLDELEVTREKLVVELANVLESRIVKAP